MTLRGTQPVRARPRLFHFPTITSDFWDKLFPGIALCALFPAKNWHNGINKEKYRPYLGLPLNLAGEILPSLSWIVSITIHYDKLG